MPARIRQDDLGQDDSNHIFLSFIFQSFISEPQRQFPVRDKVATRDKVAIHSRTSTVQFFCRSCRRQTAVFDARYQGIAKIEYLLHPLFGREGRVVRQVEYQSMTCLKLEIDLPLCPFNDG